MIQVLEMPQYKHVIFSLSFDLMLAADGINLSQFLQEWHTMKLTNQLVYLY